LTEPRIIVFYLSQIFYPVADRLSLVHDIEVSTGLFQPWKTLPAILFILGLTASATWQITKRPLFAFAVLFFLLNHIIESTIIPLELIFEHRNYLPSLFLFVPIAAGLKWTIDYYAERKKAMAILLTGFITLLVMALGTGTYVRNMAWATEYTLWQDALEKAPANARPYHNLSAGYYTDIGDYEKIIDLCSKAIDLNDSNKHKAEVLALENIANAYAKGRKNYDEVIKIYKRILNLAPKSHKTHYHLVLALIKTGQIDKAQKRLKWLISENAEELKYLTVMALIHLQKDEPENALSYLVNALRKAPDDVKAVITIGLAKSMTGKYSSATHYLGRVPENAADKTMALLLQIENSIRAGNPKKAEEYARKLILKTNPKIIRKKLKEANEPGLVWPVSTELVAPVIADVLKEQSMTISNLPNADEKKARS
jgi:tetratricopeptide (TPR) repeat protein